MLKSLYKSWPLVFVFSCLLLIGCAHRTPSSTQDIFWKFENVDASRELAERLSQDMQKCVDYLNPIFNVTPIKISIITYGNRDSFILGLQEKLNFSKENAERFRHGGAPKPSRGLFLVPPQMHSRFFCHEIVHKYTDMLIPENKIGQMKWFDEGGAEYFSGKAFDYKFENDNEFIKSNPSSIISQDRLITKEDWGKLFSNPDTRKMAYRQSQSMFAYFIEKFGARLYFELTGEKYPDFFIEWQKTLIATEPGHLKDPAFF